MPDLITHAAIAHLAGRPFESRNPFADPGPARIFLYLGVMLPDLMSRPWYILSPAVHDWVVAFHTPAGMLAACAFLSLLFERTLRKRAFALLFLGSVMHFAVDCLQRQVTGNNFWLFPFSWKNFGIGLFWAGDAIPFVPVWIALVLLMEVILHYKKSKRIRRTIEGANRKFSGMV
jgi:hypothetical protein